MAEIPGQQRMGVLCAGPAAPFSFGSEALNFPLGDVSSRGPRGTLTSWPISATYQYQLSGPATAQCHQGLCPGNKHRPRGVTSAVPQKSSQDGCSEQLHSFPDELRPLGEHWDLGCCVHIGAACSLMRPSATFIERLLYAPLGCCKLKAGPSGGRALHWPCQFIYFCFWNAGANRS